MGAFLQFLAFLAAAWEVLGVLSLFFYTLCVVLSPFIVIALFILLALGVIGGG